ncbi:hypothetical protein OROMI_003505 [Orobanche minor]
MFFSYALQRPLIPNVELSSSITGSWRRTGKPYTVGFPFCSPFFGFFRPSLQQLIWGSIYGEVLSSGGYRGKGLVPFYEEA